jgi:PAS domain S-box-containing protein
MMPSVLIVDDKVENLYLLQCLLTANGYEVTTASNGREALECAQRSPPDLVISDILMPVMDGFSLCRHWKQDGRLKAIPFVFYTATYTDPRDEEFAMNLGADLFIVKPEDPVVLTEKIQDVVKRQRSRALKREIAELPAETSYLQAYNQTLIRKLENKLIQLEEANKALAVKDFAISSSISGFVLSDLSGLITYVNPAFAKMWGYEARELIGKPSATLVSNVVSLSGIGAALRAKASWHGELEAKRKDGTLFTVQSTIHRVMDPQESPICLMASCIDITEDKRIREELQRTQKLESLSLFAAGIAHDFNNLLTGLFSNLELARNQLASDHPAQDQFVTALSVFERARDLTQRLLTFAKGGTTARRNIKVQEILRESCLLALSGASTRHELTAEKDLWWVSANSNQLSQVFNNIILNSRQAMADGGTLAISAANCTFATGQMGSLPAGGYVVIRFKDSGPGIPDEVISKIFDPFFTTKPDGSGLGLATSHSIIKNHGGHVRATSSIGLGATFEIWLPAVRAYQPEGVKESMPKLAKGVGRLLVMDDDEAIRRLTQRMLTQAGYEVTTTKNGKEAVAMYSKAASESNPYDLVILDLTIKGGMGGEETLAELLKVDPHAAAIASSGYSD